ADGEAHSLDQLVAAFAEQRHDLRLAVRALVVQALAADRLRMDHRALEAVARALSIAEPESIMAPFAEPGTAPLRGLLERTVLLSPGQRGFAQKLLDRQRPIPAARAAVEEMTEREKTVLRYLAT